MKNAPLSRYSLVALSFAAITGAGSVALGAAAAHALAEGAAEMAETASRYGLIHALALIGTALVIDRLQGATRRIAQLAAALFAVGIVLFSGGLAALAYGVNTGTAPAGGMALIAAWTALALARRRIS